MLGRDREEMVGKYENNNNKGEKLTAGGAKRGKRKEDGELEEVSIRRGVRQ